jgi:hypothetical protein
VGWLRALFRPPVPGRTRDAAMRNKKFHMPRVWYSTEHLAEWIAFLRARAAEGVISAHKCTEKIRAAARACDRQRREVGYLPAERHEVQ